MLHIQFCIKYIYIYIWYISGSITKHKYIHVYELSYLKMYLEMFIDNKKINFITFFGKNYYTNNCSLIRIEQFSQLLSIE